MQREHKGHDGRQKAGAVTFVLKLAPDLVTTAPSVRTQVDCLYEVPDVGRHGALVQVSELTGVSVRVVDDRMLKERLD